MNTIINSELVAIPEKSKKIESGWTFGKMGEMQLYFSFFETGSSDIPNSIDTEYATE